MKNKKVSTADKKKRLKEWIVFFVCLMLLLLVWQKLQQTGEPPQPPEYYIFKRAASEHDPLHNFMLASLERIDIDSVKNPEERQLFADLQHNLKKCQGISVARNQVLDRYNSMKRRFDHIAFGVSIVPVAILGFCVWFILILLKSDKKTFSWKKVTVVVLLSITIAVALQRSFYWGALADMRPKPADAFALNGYEMAKYRFYEKYYPEVIAPEWNPDP